MIKKNDKINCSSIKKHGLTVFIVLLLTVASFTPLINMANSSTVDAKEKSFITCYMFGNMLKENRVELPSEIVLHLHSVFEELQYYLMYYPLDAKTQTLKSECIELLFKYNIISEEYSKNDVLSLLNPTWLDTQKNTNTSFETSFNTILNGGMCFLCRILSGGEGILIPFAVLPRPRFYLFWRGKDNSATILNFAMTRESVIEGKHLGISFGFTGFAFMLSFSNTHGFYIFGYSLFTAVFQR